MADRHRRVRAAAITGLGQLLGLVGSTLIGVLVAGTLPPSPRVDAFFGANQIYALALYLGQAVRITAPALLVRSGLAPPRLRDATLVLTGAMVAVMVGAAVFGGEIVPSASRDAFQSDLLYLAPAAALHVSAGGLAARLSVVGSFGYAAAAYAAGSLVSGLLLLVVIDGAGASALAPCLLAGACAVAVIMALGYARQVGRSWQPARAHAAAIPGLVAAPAGAPVGSPSGRIEPALAVMNVSPDAAVVGAGPSATTLAAPPTARFAVRRIGLGAVPALSLQLLITVVTVAAGHVQSGGTALLSYSFLALFAFSTIAVTPMSIVLGPEMAERWGGDQATLHRIVREATRISVVVATPLVALGFLVGRPLAGDLLGALTDRDLDQVFEMLVVLAPTLILTAAATAATVGITTADRLGPLAVRLLVVSVATIIGGIAIADLGPSLPVVALIAAGFITAASVVALHVAVGRSTLSLIVQVVGENISVIAPTVVATILCAKLADGGLLAGMLLGLIALAVHVAVVAMIRRDTLELLAGAVRGGR